MDNMQFNEQNTAYPESGTPIYQPQPVAQKKRVRTVSVRLMVTLVLVCALICGCGGAGLMYALTSSGDESTASADAINDKTVAESESPSNSNTASDSGSSLASTGISTAVSSNSTATSDNALQACMGTVVGIDVTYTSYSSYYGYDSSGSETTGSGSGVILTSDGYIITNNHVIESATGITVYLQDGAEYAAELIGVDAQTDIAVLKIDASNLPFATVGDSTLTNVGDTVYAIGNPLGSLACSVSSGIISGLERTIEVDGISMTLMQTDAAVNPGNSGGGLFNEKGELIGIVNCKSLGLEVEGLGFAIPMETVLPAAEDLMDYGYVSGRPYIGISMQDVSLFSNSGGQSGFGYSQGGYITRPMIIEVATGSAAEAAGLQVNDIIFAFDNTEVASYSELSSLLYEYEAGDSVTITVMRGNETLNISLTLGERSAA